MLGAAGAHTVLRHPIARLWGDSGDAWQNLWNGWWVGEALRRGRSPFDCDLLWHPDGIDLWLHTLGPVNAAATAIGQAIFPGFLGFNLLVFAQLLFGAMAGFWLLRALLPRAFPELRPRALFAGALLGGFAFGFSPYVWGHAAVHLHLSSVGVVGLFVLFLERALRGEHFGVPGMALLALATALTGWYLLVDEALLGVVFLGAAAIRLRREGRGPLLRLAAGGALAGVLIAPLLWRLLRASAQPLGGTHDPRVFALDLLSPFVPSATQAIGGPFRALTGRFSGNAAENATALGLSALLLLGVALFVLRRRIPGRYLAAGLLGLLVSTGPDLKFGGASVRGLGIFYRAMEAVAPPLAGLGCPVRFALLANLAVAVGAALGLAALLQRAASASRPWRSGSGLLGALLALALLVEFWPAPPPTSRYPTPAFLTELARPKGALADGLAVADLTGWTHPLYNQTLHGRPIVHGYTSRRPLPLVQKIERDPVLGPLLALGLHGRAPRGRLHLQGPAAWAHLRETWGVGWVIAYAGRASFLLEGQLRLQVLAREEGMVLYRVPQPKPRTESKGERDEALE